MTGFNCPICHQKVFSEAGKACKLCGMALADEGKDFCCGDCRSKFEKFDKTDKFGSLDS